MNFSSVGWRSCLGLISRWPASSILAAATIFAGCTPAPLIKPVPVDVTKYVKQTIPAQLLAPCEVVEPDRGCWRDTKPEFCNGQLVEMLTDYKAALATCNSQIQAIKEANRP